MLKLACNYIEIYLTISLLHCFFSSSSWAVWSFELGPVSGKWRIVVVWRDRVEAELLGGWYTRVDLKLHIVYNLRHDFVCLDCKFSEWWLMWAKGESPVMQTFVDRWCILTLYRLQASLTWPGDFLMKPKKSRIHSNKGNLIKVTALDHYLDN